nr:PREDICTED: alpha-2C adrenergic receptor-like isoform X1 [Lepisosteus oculatus]XP_015200121.1 PREDICTED: alpha-2C adrenergic receptor-like isoform X1 [Lepisosteus oculatus]
MFLNRNSSWLANLSVASSLAELDIAPPQVAVGVLLTLIDLVTFLGNTVVFICPAVERRLRTVTYMFIMSLAMADLLVACLVMPFSIIYEVTGVWLFGEHFCKMWISFDVLFCTASIVTLCFISLDRYCSVVTPYHYPRRMSRRSISPVVWRVTPDPSLSPCSTSPVVYCDDGDDLGVLVSDLLPSSNAGLERNPGPGLRLGARLRLCHQLDLCHRGFGAGVLHPLPHHVHHVLLHLPRLSPQGHPHRLSDPGPALPPRQPAAQQPAAGEQGHAHHEHHHLRLRHVLAALLRAQCVAGGPGLGRGEPSHQLPLQDHHLAGLLQLNHQPYALRLPQPRFPACAQEAAGVPALALTGGHRRGHGVHRHLLSHRAGSRVQQQDHGPAQCHTDAEGPAQAVNRCVGTPYP